MQFHSTASYIASYFVCDSLLFDIPKIFVGILDHKNIFYMKKLKHQNFTMQNFQIYGTKLSGVNYCILETFAGENLCKLAESVFFIEKTWQIARWYFQGTLAPKFY